MPVYGPPVLELLDLPLLNEDIPALYAAGFADPWPGGLALYRQAEGGSPQFQDILPAQCQVGQLKLDLPAGPVATCDQGSVLRISLSSGQLASAALADVLAGANLLAVKSRLGSYELISFETAELQPDGAW